MERYEPEVPSGIQDMSQLLEWIVREHQRIANALQGAIADDEDSTRLIDVLGYTPVNKAGDSMAGQLLLPDGSLANPSLANVGDANTGVRFPADNELALVTDGADRIKIDSQGRVKLPYQPRFHAHHTTVQGPGPGVVTFPTVLINVGNHFNGATGVFTAPIAGDYFFHWHGLSGGAANAQLPAATAGHGWLEKNGAPWGNSNWHVYVQSSSSHISFNTASVISLAVGDTVRCWLGGQYLYQNYNGFLGFLLG